MRRPKLVLIFIALGSVIAYGAYLGYLARLSYKGYCHAAGKYLTDDEKIRMAVADVVKTYPPSVYPARTENEELRIGRPPVNPIYYQDVDDFLRLNPNCCSVSLIYKGSESVEPGFLERITGATSGFVTINYSVRYLGADNKLISKKDKATVPISNCGKPVHWWDPVNYSDLFFILQFIKYKDTL